VNILTDEPARHRLQSAATNGLDPASVARFLRRNPAWLAAQPELWRALEPPQRVHGEPLADHMAAMLTAERAFGAMLLARTSAAASLAARVQTAVIALMRSRDPLDCVVHEWPGLLGVDAASFCSTAASPGARPLPRPFIPDTLRGAPALIRAGSADPVLHGEAALLARTEALILVPLAAPALLALACRDATALAPDGIADLAFLGRALAARLASP